MSWYLSNYGSFNVFSSKSWRLVSVLPAWTDWVGSVLDRRMCPAVRMTRTVQERSCVVGVNVRSMSAPHQVHIICIYSTHWNVVFMFYPFPLSRHFMFTVNLSFSKHDYNELTFKVKPVSISLVLKPIINLSVLSNYWE